MEVWADDDFPLGVVGCLVDPDEGPGLFRVTDHPAGGDVGAGADLNGLWFRR